MIGKALVRSALSGCGVFILASSHTACGSLEALVGQSSGTTTERIKDPLMHIQRGMLIEEVHRLLGTPAFRHFQPEYEEYEYRIKRRGILTSVFVQVKGGRVEAMHSEPTPIERIEQRIDVPTHRYPTYPVYPQAPIPPSDDRWFEDFIQRYQRTSFSDDKEKLLRMATQGQMWTVDQCLRLLKLHTFEDDRFKCLRLIAPALYDRQNAYKIIDLFSFSSSKNEAERLIFP